MIAIVLDECQHARTVLHAMVLSLGYQEIHFAQSLEEFDYLSQQFGQRVRLIIASQSSAGGLDVPLSRLIIQNRALDLATFILTVSSRFSLAFRPVRTRHSRIDATLAKPFGYQKLLSAIIEAQESRATLRNTLLVLGHAVAADAASVVFSSGDSTHWRTVTAVESPQEFHEALTKLGFRIGGILIDPGFCTSKKKCEVLDSVKIFKKTLMGAQTPVALLSLNSDAIRPVQSFVDLYFEAPHDLTVLGWKNLLRIFSHRLLFDWEAKRLFRATRLAIKSNQWKLASRFAKAGLKSDSHRWEFLALSGFIAAKRGLKQTAVEQLEHALHTNPAAPSLYLSLLPILEGTEKVEMQNRAKLYCPAHPQVLNLIRGLG